MFGYVRPLRAELKCREFDLYQATYCGLCRCLRQRCGLLAPMTLTYDFTFLALLLWEPEERFVPCRGRCHANPLVKKPMCPVSPALELAAAESVVLARWKLRDDIADGGLWERIPARLLSGLLRPAYQRAAGAVPEFDRMVEERLARLEQEAPASLDRPADLFASLLQGAAPAMEDEAQARVVSTLLYHLGRWIYLIDARDDLEEDRRAGRYNPVAARYGPEGDDEALALTLEQSLGFAGAALQLGEFGCRKGILENILYLGLPLVQRAVLDGSWAQVKNQKIWRNNP